MKGNKKILVAALLVLLIAVSFTTYAIYKTSVAGTAEVTAARWDVEFKDGSDTLTNNYEVTLSGSDCSNNHVAPGKIAPGASCTKQIVLDATNAEVDVTYTATVDSANITAEKGGSTVATTNANAFTATLSPASGTITYDASTKTATLTLTVSWAGTEETTTTDPADTALSGATITVPVTLVAKQVVGA